MSKIYKDIVVVGGGIAGICAAVAAARSGEDTTLIESYSYLGGTATAALVSPFMKYHVNDKPLVEGIFTELQDKMRAKNGMLDNGFLDTAFIEAANELLEDAGVEVLLNTELISVNSDGKDIRDITVKINGIDLIINAIQYIDASGDAALTYQSGAAYELSKDQQALTLFFKMKNIDLEKAIAYVAENPDNFFPWSDKHYDPQRIMSVAGYWSEIKETKDAGLLSKAVNYIFFCTLPEPGTASFNCVNLLGYDGTNPKDISKAHSEGVHQVNAILQILKHIPGFEHAVLDKMADKVGIRETRRVIGDYIVTGDDIRQGRKFEDAIAKGCYGVDIHGKTEDDSVMEELPEGEYYEIPKRALFVKDKNNLMAVGRCISSSKEGQAALRIMPTCAATGEAAGIIAAKAIKEKITIREVNYKGEDSIESIS